MSTKHKTGTEQHRPNQVCYRVECVCVCVCARLDPSHSSDTSFFCYSTELLLLLLSCKLLK